jgi:hypothetical protein
MHVAVDAEGNQTDTSYARLAARAQWIWLDARHHAARGLRHMRGVVEFLIAESAMAFAKWVTGSSACRRRC